MANLQSQEGQRNNAALRMASQPHHVVEYILERLPVTSLMRFKAVSKQWESTISSTSFQERHLMQRQQSGDPDVLMVSISPYDVIGELDDIESLRTLVLGSSSSDKILTHWENRYYSVSNASCDGLVCLYDAHKPGFVVNPTTRWYRPLPLSQFQEFITSLEDSYYELKNPHFKLGFGKDRFTGTYKPVWLYNSSVVCLGNATTCEVFDFSTNAWRYVYPAAPYQVIGDPVYVDGSLYWFTECKEIKIISFDLHTETFQVLSKAPFANVHAHKIVMCNLDNCLCFSEMMWPNQVIWSFDSGNKTWHKMCSIDLEVTSQWFGFHLCALSPLALFDGDLEVTSQWFGLHLCALPPLALFDGEKKKKKTKLLFYCRVSRDTLMVHDLETKSYDVAFHADSIGSPVCYFQSLISIS